MPWTVQNPTSLFVEQAYELYNTTPATRFPAASGMWGIDANVWRSLVDLMIARLKEIGIKPPNEDLKGSCIWGAVIAAKFFSLRRGNIASRVVRVKSTGSDHYFVVLQTPGGPGICDITCRQFVPAPDFIVGTLSEIKNVAKKVKVDDASLYDAYALGAATQTFVM